MRRVFIADAHLRRPEDRNYQTLLSFLSDIQDTVNSLYIMGDLFEFWLGYDATAFPHYMPVLDLLQRLADKGVEIVYFEGNHDFHLGPFFQKALRAKIFPGPALLDLDGKKVYLCHGDQINAKDIGYRTLRMLLHNTVVKRLFPLFPASFIFRLAEYLSLHSKKNHASRNSKCNYETLIRRFASERFHEGCNVLITAHFHLPFIASINSDNNSVILSLGDWINQFTYGEMSEGKVSLHYYHP